MSIFDLTKTKDIMKTLENEIQLHSAEEIRTGVRVFFSIVDDNGIADVKMVVPAEYLHNFIESNDLNREEFINYAMYNMECDGLDERFVPADEYLTENLDKTVQSYLEKNYNANV